MKTIAALLKAALGSSSPQTLLWPNITISREGPITGSIRVGECGNCCDSPTPRLMVIPVLQVIGTMESRVSEFLSAPSRSASILATGPQILDAWDYTELDSTRDDYASAWEVGGDFTILQGGEVSVSLSFLGMLNFDIFRTSPRTEASLAERLKEVAGSESIRMEDSKIGTVIPYCACVAENADDQSSEERRFDVFNAPPTPHLQSMIEIPLNGSSRVPEAFRVTDHEGDPVWIYVEVAPLRSGSISLEIDTTTGDTLITVMDVDPGTVAAMRNVESKISVYIYDLKKDAVVIGDKPQRGQYFNKVVEDVTIRFVGSGPRPIDIVETMTTAALLEAGNSFEATFLACAADPFGELSGITPDVAAFVPFRGLGIAMLPETIPAGIVVTPLFSTERGMAYTCEQDCEENRSLCSARASCVYQGEGVLSPGTYNIAFEVYEVDSAGTKWSQQKTGSYTLEVIPTPPHADDHAFSNCSSSTGRCMGVVEGDVLPVETDVDGDRHTVILADAPAHGELAFHSDGERGQAFIFESPWDSATRFEMTLIVEK